MATQKTGADAVGVYLTNASASVSECEPDNSLGGFRSSTEIEPVYALISTDIPEIVIENVLGLNGIGGQGAIHATSTTALTYTAPGGSTAGTAVTIADGATVLLMEAVADGDDKGVRVRRDGSDDLGNRSPEGMRLDFVNNYNGLVGMKDVTEAQRAAGVTTYRAAMLNAHGSQAITNLKVWQQSGNPNTIAIAKEAPVSAEIQTIATETTVPSGLSWNTGTTSGTGLDIGSVSAGASYGLWIRRVVALGADEEPSAVVRLNMSFTAGGTSYTQALYGGYRIAKDSLIRFELHIGEDVDPDLSTAADATSATLPFSHGLTPGGGDVEFRFTVLKRNEYGLVSLNEYFRSITLDNSGAEVRGNPGEPEVLSITEGASGEIDIVARYSQADTFPADQFAIYVRGDATNPTFAASERTLVEMSARDPHNPGAFSLTLSIGPYAKGADVRVVVRSHRLVDGLESTNTAATTIVISTKRPLKPQALAFGFARMKISDPFTQIVTVIDAGDSVQWEQNAGYTDLTKGGVIVFRLRYNADDTTNNGLWTTYAHQQGSLGSDLGPPYPTEYSSPLLHIHVGTAERMRWATGTSITTNDGLTQVAASVLELTGSDPIEDGSGWHSCFQVYDECAGNYVSVLSLADDGSLALKVPWRQVALVSEIP